MDLAELVRTIHVIELSSQTRREAIREMAEAACGTNPEFSIDQLITAVEDREATAQTVVAPGFALPHAFMEQMSGSFVALGRSHAGIPYGIPGSERVHLIVLLIIGPDSRDSHLGLLAAVAELLRVDDFRNALAMAPDIAVIQKLLRCRVGLEAESLNEPTIESEKLDALLVEHAVRLAESLSAQGILLTVDRLQDIPWDRVSQWNGQLLIATSEISDERAIVHPDMHLFEVPQRGLSRSDRANLGLLLAASSGLLDDNSWVVCVTGVEREQLDCISVARPAAHWKEMFPGESGGKSTAARPEVLLRVLSLAIELATEGREGRSIGTMFVVGDVRGVSHYTQQMILNPFHGFSRDLRNLLDPSLTETIKEFAQLDGAFIVRNDGSVQSAGTYLAPEVPEIDLPPGLGARHTTAAAITAHTHATAVTVSQSTGMVTVFRRGRIALKLERATKTRW